MLPSGQVAAQRHGTTRLLWPGEYLAHDATGAPRPGTRLSLYWKREAAIWQPGFYFAFGEMVPDHSDETRFARFYWHVRAAAAPSLLEQVSAALNRFQIPFRFKFLNNSGLYGRNDAAVLYAARRHFHVVTNLLAQLHPGMQSGLGDETPLFTKLLAPGLGFAEDPGNGESFGMSRCRLLAEAVVEAFHNGQQTVAARLQATERRFRDAGVSLTAPHLNFASIDDYLWPTN